jgi:ribosomal protein L4
VELLKQVKIASKKLKTQAVCVITIKKINMSEKELKNEKASKVTVLIPFALLVATMLFLSSCSTSAHCQGNVWGAATSCPAYR